MPASGGFVGGASSGRCGSGWPDVRGSYLCGCACNRNAGRALSAGLLVVQMVGIPLLLSVGYATIVAAAAFIALALWVFWMATR